MSEKRRGLGRGLGALIPSGPVMAAEATTADSGTTTGKKKSPEQQPARTGTGTPKSPATADAASSKPGTEPQSGKGTSEVPSTQEQTKKEKAQLPALGRSVARPDRENSAAGEEAGNTSKTSGNNASTHTEDAAAGTTEKKPIVSRETSPETRDPNRKPKHNGRSRRDMGQALRNTTSVRRPVDMFFLPSDESEENIDSDPSTSPGEQTQHHVSRETSATSPTILERANDSLTGGDAPAQDANVPAATSAPLESGSASGAVSKQRLSSTQTSNTRLNSSQAARSNSTVSRETSPDMNGGTGGDQLDAVPGAEFAEIPVADIHPNRKQPRQVFDEDELAELAFSVKELGVLQPVVVRPSREGEGAKYELVMGERRWRAVQKAGLDSVPAIIRETADDDLLRDALLENLHRSQLNPLEEAAAYQQLLDEFGATQDELSRRIGRSRPQISNTLRLLRLPPLVQRRVAAGVLSSGHARALLGLTDPADMERLAQRVVAEGMSVRATEETVALSDGLKRHGTKRKSATHRHDDRLNYIADAFSDRLDTSVKIQLGARKGKMTIEFATVEDLNRIIDVLDPKLENQS